MPEILKEFSPQEDAVFGKLLRLLPNLISFAAQNLPIGVHQTMHFMTNMTKCRLFYYKLHLSIHLCTGIQTWKALADSCSGSITHIDVTGCIGVGAACVGEEQGQYLTALARMSKLKGAYVHLFRATCSVLCCSNTALLASGSLRCIVGPMHWQAPFNTKNS